MLAISAVLAALLGSWSAVATTSPSSQYPHAGGPLACQPNEKYPMLPTFHIIGNVTQTTDGSIKLEPINDCSGVTFYKGIYHVWHQCCQNHWDHVISKDLIHWQRLPPPIQSSTGDHAVWGATGERTFDGSISMLSAEDGGPIILYDAPDRIPKGYPGCGECILSIARLNKTDDKYLQLFTRDDGGGNPVNLTGQNMTKGAHNGPVDFPSTIWKNGDHWNFVAQGGRFTTKDKSFRKWARVEPDFVDCHESGGQWWIPMPNQIGGSPPPAGTPNWLVNCGGGNTYRIGNYYPANESFVWDGVSVTQLEHGGTGWWGAQGGAANNNRMMMIGWVGDYGDPVSHITYTRLSALREVNWDVKTQNLVVNPLPELLGLRTSRLSSERIAALSVNNPHVIAKTGVGAAASSDVELKFSGFKTAAGPAGIVFGACVLSNGSIASGSGIGVTVSVTPGPKGTHVANIASGQCGVRGSGATFTIFADEDELAVRILADRSVADIFLQGGRWAATQGWQHTAPRKPADSQVVVWSGSSGLSVQVDVHAMGCGWLNPSYTDKPLL